ncbi:MAG: transposase [Gammaproteobacteria bacterium]
MARLPRLCLPGIPQHIIQRGTNRQACFASEEDFAAYAYWLEEAARKHGVAIHAWVFMTNHVHLLVTPETSRSISAMMQTLGRHVIFGVRVKTPSDPQPPPDYPTGCWSPIRWRRRFRTTAISTMPLADTWGDPVKTPEDSLALRGDFAILKFQ